jgi:hypothetical protein
VPLVWEASWRVESHHLAEKSDPPTSAWLMPAKNWQDVASPELSLKRLQAVRSLAGNRWSLLKTCLKEVCYA